MSMRDEMDVGPVPYEEDCQQVGTPEYDHEKARKESRVYKHMLLRLFGEEPGAARIRVLIELIELLPVAAICK